MENQRLTLERLRSRTWEVLEVARAGDRLSRGFDTALVGLIVLNVVVFVAGTVPSVASRYGAAFFGFEVFSVAVFSLEYVLRVLCATSDPRFREPLAGRIRYMASPLAVIDFLAVLPFYLPMIGVDLRVLRLFRLLRVLRVLKLGRYSESLQLIQVVVAKKRQELAATLFVVIVLLVLSASVVYYAEADAQPKTFGSIPHCMWWGVATLTTVGYGDVYPVTPIGKFVGSAVAILGIGMFALPTGILGAAFAEELAARKSRREASGPRTSESTCPHCGSLLPEHERVG